MSRKQGKIIVVDQAKNQSVKESFKESKI